jgi:hypothetical protein
VIIQVDNSSVIVWDSLRKKPCKLPRPSKSTSRVRILFKMFFFMQYIYIYIYYIIYIYISFTNTLSLINFLQSLGKIHCREKMSIEPNNYILY